MAAVPIAKAADGVESSQTMRLLQEQMESLQMQLNLLRNAVHPAVQSQPSKAKGAEAPSVQGGAPQGGQMPGSPELLPCGLCKVLREHTHFISVLREHTTNFILSFI
jgi:hypothetical protein